MLHNAKVLGVDMNRRSNRRMLVLITYAAVVIITIAFSLAVVYVPQIRIELLAGGMWFFTTAWFLIAYFVFGRIASPFPLVPLFRYPPQQVDRGLGLSATVPPEEPQPDERDLSIRNSAYYVAYNIFIWICLAGFIALPLYEKTSLVMHKTILFTAVVLLGVLAFTLPQAVVLWRERDLPQDV